VPDAGTRYGTAARAYDGAASAGPRGPAEARDAVERDAAVAGSDEAACLRQSSIGPRDGRAARGPGQAGQFILGQRQGNFDDALGMAPESFSQVDKKAR